MYSTRSGLVLGFHGCDKSAAVNVVERGRPLRPSKNPWDWLGTGIYFWENSPARALEFAVYLRDHPLPSRRNRIVEPAVVGAVLDLGFCLDLLNYENLKWVKQGYESVSRIYSKAGYKLPTNRTAGESNDRLLRFLDCLVINFVQDSRSAEKMQPFDSVRGVFWEGDELYPHAGFREKDHIQICIVNPNCIKGYFYPRTLSTRYSKV